MPITDMPRPFTLRPATPDDLPVVRALLQSAGLAPNALDAQFGPQFVVALDAGTQRVVGAEGVEVYRDTSGDVGLLRSAVVDAAWRGAGIGAALTEDRLSWAETERLAAVYLLTETAAEYWPRFGFARTARDGAPSALQASHEWRQGCPASAVAMHLSLPRTR
ncbi:MAG: GNAT family N-acetyltransferase [Gemmatimonadota bacterium]